MTGQELWSRSASGAHISENIDLSAFGKGLYQLSIRDAAGRAGIKRIVRE
jgi:hypothetical protein